MRTFGDGIIFADAPIFENDHPLGEMGDVGLMGDQDNSKALVIQALEQLSGDIRN